MKSLKNKLLPLAVLAVALIAVSCGGGGGGGGVPANCADPTVDLTGTWTLSEAIASTDCPDPVGPRSYTVEVVQTGNTLTITLGADAGDLAGTVYTGYVCGDTVNWTGSYVDPENGGTVTVTSTNITATDTSLSGTASWSWTDGTLTCSGTTAVTGVTY